MNGSQGCNRGLVLDEAVMLLLLVGERSKRVKVDGNDYWTLWK